MKVNRSSEIVKSESIKVTKRFRIVALIANTIYGNTKEELIKMVTNREIYGDYYELQEYRYGEWIAVGKFVTK